MKGACVTADSMKYEFGPVKIYLLSVLGQVAIVLPRKTFGDCWSETFLWPDVPDEQKTIRALKKPKQEQWNKQNCF